MAAPHVVEVPVSVAYVVVDARGRVLATVGAFEEATRVSRLTPGAFAVLGSPSGTVLARVAASGASVSSEADARIAARRWAKAASP